MGLAKSRWKFVATNLSGGSTGVTLTGPRNVQVPTNGGEVFNAKQRAFSYYINAARTCTFQVDVDNPIANFLLNNNCLIKAYRQTLVSKQWQLQMVGDLISTEETSGGEEGVITCIAADPFWRLNKRMVGLGIDSSGRGVGFKIYTAAVQGELGAGLLLALATLNDSTQGGMPTGVVPGTSTGVTNSFIGPTYATPFGVILQQVSATLGGPDTEFVPMEPSLPMPNTTIATLNFKGHLGTAFPNNAAVFEYGTGKKNVQSYSRLRSKDQLANYVISQPQGFPGLVAAGDSPVIASDTGSILTQGRFDNVLATDGLSSLPLRTALAQQSLQVFKNVQQQIMFVPSSNIDVDYGVDYNVGDVVTARAYDRMTNTFRYNGSIRIYGVDIQVTEDDEEIVGLVLIPPTN